jgi:hypothetical protein
MNYQKIQDNIISKAKNENRKKTKDGLYYELHHIIPKCMCGDNNKENLVLLTAKEHFLVHWLLAEIHDTNSLWFAFNRMCHTTIKNKDNRTYKVSSRIYELLKSKLSEKQKGKKHSEETKNKMSQKKKGKPLHPNAIKASRIALNNREPPMKGKKHSEESKNKMSNSAKGRKGINMSESHKKIISDTHKGKKLSELTKLKMSLSKKGKGHNHSESSKLKLSENSGKSVAILQYSLNNEFIKEWKSISSAFKKGYIGNISACCRGLRKTANGYIWKYKINNNE